jgi:hypothetical protein
VGLRHVARRRALAAESDGAGHDQRRIETHTPNRAASLWKNSSSLLSNFEGPFHTIALVCVCFGLRISECLALRWSDVDWLNGTLNVERGIVHQVIDDVKTPESQRSMPIDNGMLDVLKTWKQTTQFRASDD